MFMSCALRDKFQVHAVNQYHHHRYIIQYKIYKKINKYSHEP